MGKCQSDVGYEHWLTVRFHHVVHVPFKLSRTSVSFKFSQASTSSSVLTTLDICQHYAKACFSNHVLTQKCTQPPWGAASWGGGAVDGGSVNVFLATALTRVMRATVPIPTVASASVLHAAAVGGSVVGVVRPL